MLLKVFYIINNYTRVFFRPYMKQFIITQIYSILLIFLNTGASAKAYADIIRGNLHKNMKVLVKGADKLGIKVNSETALKQYFSIDSRGEWRNEWTTMFKTLWNDSGIQEVYSKRSLLQVSDSTAYYFSNIDRIASPDYLPTQQDILRARHTFSL